MPKLPSYIIRRGKHNNLYFRMGIPERLRSFLDEKREFITSLKTSDVEEAKARKPALEAHARSQLSAAKRKFEATQKPAVAYLKRLSEEELQSVVLGWFHGFDRQNHARIRQSLGNQPDAEEEIIDSIKGTLEAIDAELGQSFEFLGKRRPITETVEGLLEELAITIPSDSEQYTRLRELIARGLFESNTRLLEQFQTVQGRRADTYFKAIDSEAPLPADVTENHPKTRLTIAGLLEKYLKEKKQLSRKTVIQYETNVRRLEEFIGANTAIDSLTRDDFVEYREILCALPPNATKRYPNMSYREIIAANTEHAPLQTRTINKALETISALLKYGYKNELIKRNHAEGLRLAEEEAEEDSAKSFKIEHLKKMFSAPLYTGCMN